MSKYQFCVGCEHIITKEVKSVHWTPENKAVAIQITCPAQFNPYEPMKDNQDFTKANPHGCPRNEKFIEMEDRKKEAIRGSNR